MDELQRLYAQRHGVSASGPTAKPIQRQADPAAMQRYEAWLKRPDWWRLPEPPDPEFDPQRLLEARTHWAGMEPNPKRYQLFAESLKKQLAKREHLHRTYGTKLDPMNKKILDDSRAFLMLYEELFGKP